MEKNKKPKFTIPAAALKRFANNLEEDVNSSKFLQINRTRVTEFLEKQDGNGNQNFDSTPTKPDTNTSCVPGIYTYHDEKKERSFIHLQRLPEFKQELGFRSRFGEGDGSFFDQWLNGGIIQSDKVSDKKGLPIMGANVEHDGFKKYIQEYKDSVNNNADHLNQTRRNRISTYVERRKKRLEGPVTATESKKETDSVQQNSTNFLNLPLDLSPDPQQAQPKFLPRRQSNSNQIRALADQLIVPSLQCTPNERETYFGPTARAEFFNEYRSISRNRLYANGSNQALETAQPLTETQSMSSTSNDNLNIDAEKEKEIKDPWRGNELSRTIAKVSSLETTPKSPDSKVGIPKRKSASLPSTKPSTNEIEPFPITNLLLLSTRERRHSSPEHVQPSHLPLLDTNHSSHPNDLKFAAKTKQLIVNELPIPSNNIFSTRGSISKTRSNRHEGQFASKSSIPFTRLHSKELETNVESMSTSFDYSQSKDEDLIKANETLVDDEAEIDDPFISELKEDSEDQLLLERLLTAPFIGNTLPHPNPEQDSNSVPFLAVWRQSSNASNQSSRRASFLNPIEENIQMTAKPPVTPLLIHQEPGSPHKTFSNSPSMALLLSMNNTKRPISARTKFLMGCVNQGVAPQPSLIVRREYTTSLNISSMGIGDKMAILLSESLELLPALQGLYLADNKLTNKSLVPIILKLSNCEQLKSLDLSFNRIDLKIAQTLAEFLNLSSTGLISLFLKKCQIDDRISSILIQAISTRLTLKELDLGSNKLGSHVVEYNFKHLQNNAIISLTKLLENSACQIQILKLPWNMIRFDYAAKLMYSIQFNQSLVYLDLSYNGLGVEGGEILGSSLHLNNTLAILKVAHNNLTARATFTILCGARSCRSLRELDLSENPIGEIGARALLSFNLSHGHRLSVDIKGCSLRVADPACWFDFAHPKTSCSLNLESPYERAVAIEILRLASKGAKPSSLDSNNYELPISDCILQVPPERSGVSLKLGVHVALVDSAYFEAHRNHDEAHEVEQNIYDVSSDIDTARMHFQKSASKIFKQFDSDESGALDKNELVELLRQMGIQDATVVMDKIMKTYDTDGSGLVEEEEFINFLLDVRSTVERTNENEKQIRYIYAENFTPSSPHSQRSSQVMNSRPTTKHGSSSNSPLPFLPPTKGTLIIKFRSDKGIPEIFDVVRFSMVDTLISTSKNVAEGTAIFEKALSSMRLNFTESKVLFKVMFKEFGSKVQALHMLLPRMASSYDAQLLITATIGNDIKSLRNLRQILGAMFNIYLGIPSGFYNLSLNEPKDREMLERLSTLNDEVVNERRFQGFGDLSQYGNWSICFRNGVLDGNRIQMNKDFFDHLPMKGKLCFDFIYCKNISMSECATISNNRFARVLTSLGIILEGMRGRMVNKIMIYTTDGRNTSRGTGVRKWEMYPIQAEEIGNHLDSLYNGIPSQRGMSIYDAVVVETTSASFSDNGILKSGTEKTPRSSRSGHGDVQIDVGNKKPTPRSGRTDKNSEGNTPESNIMVDNGNNGESNLTEIYSQFLKMKYPSALSLQFSLYMIEAVVHILSGRFLTCAQLAILISFFPGGSVTINSFSTARVEVVITLFSRLVDKINFDYILKELDNVECAMLYYRIGWLNIWNPLKAEGAVRLDLSRHEERQIARILLVLCFEETGETWVEKTYRPTRSSEPTPNWKLPILWYSESSLPVQGLLTVLYFSGKGVQLNGCIPKLSCRMHLMPVVLSRPYEEDLRPFHSVNMEKLDSLLENVGLKLTFRVEKQKPLPMST